MSHWTPGLDGRRVPRNHLAALLLPKECANFGFTYLAYSAAVI